MAPFSRSKPWPGTMNYIHSEDAGTIPDAVVGVRARKPAVGSLCDRFLCWVELYLGQVGLNPETNDGKPNCRPSTSHRNIISNISYCAMLLEQE